MKVTYADRINELPPYLFEKIDQLKAEMQKTGADIIDLGVGDPDLPTPKPIIEVLQREVENPLNHRYPFTRGMEVFRRSVAEWYNRRFEVHIQQDGEVVSVIGSKEGISHVPVAFVNPGDVVLVPEPAYPVYAITAKFSGGEVSYMPLLEKNGYLPDLSAVDDDTARRARLMYLNYPNNPTSAIADEAYFKDVVTFAKKHNIIVVHDAAYTELYFNTERPMSFLEVEGAKDVGMEIHSLSKSFNMTGWRVGFAVGNQKIVGGLGKAKSNMDSGIFQPIQAAAAFALDHADELSVPIRDVYRSRRNVLASALKKAGLQCSTPSATFYFWVRVPEGYTSESFTELMLKKAHIVVTPGSGFGPSGEGYVRLTLCTTEERLIEAGRRIVDAMKKD
ncbi:MAG: LL-diaminopimelate aminotransferase [Deltaproteobacteria bacterium]|nr:LL-diaminopimelate aminotransferase [Candidatus Zymogenaceae bacterium]